MVQRTFWLKLLESAWERKSIVWLAGVRRVGKTCLCQSIPNIEYFDCELPRIRRSMEDPESFWAGLKGKRVILDEIHRLSNPSEILKIAADHFPSIKVIATGSSTLQASTRFRDTLAGRKVEVEFMSLFPLSPVPGGERFDVSSAASNLLLTIHSHKSIFQLLFLSLSR